MRARVLEGERQDSTIEHHNDVRSAVVAEVEFQAAAAFGTSRPRPENLEAAIVQSGRNVQFFIRGVGGAQTQVVRGGWHDALGQVAGIKGLDVNHAVSLYTLGITPL